MANEPPDGIGERNLVPRNAFTRRYPWYPLAAIGLLLAVAFTGVLGGGNSPQITASGEIGSLTIEAPATLRNGEFFEMHFMGEAHAPLSKPTLAIKGSYWNDLTINTMIPAPASESFEDGYFVFEFDPMDAGALLHLKVDGQVNPPMFGGTRGAVEWRDGDRVLAETDVRLRVLP